MKAQRIALGMVACQRTFELYTPEGDTRSVTVRLGMPVATNLEGRVLRKGKKSSGTFRCPLHITGLGHDVRVDGVFGGDPFVSLQYALSFIGDRLDQYSKDLGLTNRHRTDGTRDSWLWLYPPDQQR